jgi:ornithine cyclodeaminase/alanine dehydrogenase-like protein (mu-crystallin family)
MIMEILYLSRKDVEQIGVSMKEVIEAVDRGFRLKGLQKAEMPPKPGIHTMPNSFINAMPAYVKEVESAGLKWISVYPSNIGMGLPSITGLLILNDPKTGVPMAVMDCTWITAMRTGASVGISAKYLARKESRVAGILGCGVQARKGLSALVETLPRLSDVRCYDLYPAASRRFRDDLAGLFPRLTKNICSSPAEMMEGADVVVTAIPMTTNPNPPLDAGMLKEGGLAVSLDYDSAWTTRAMRECERFVSDDVRQLSSAKEEGRYFKGIPEKIDDLGEIAAGLKPGRRNDSERIFSMNVGIAVEDMVTAKLIYDNALAKGAGTKLPL